jgi:hypothetical protein
LGELGPDLARGFADCKNFTFFNETNAFRPDYLSAPGRGDRKGRIEEGARAYVALLTEGGKTPYIYPY